MNEYEAYAENDGTDPIKVTIPFTDFVERDTQGNPAGGLAQDKTSITSFGLWVNAIPGTDAIGDDGMVTGTIIYDVDFWNCLDFRHESAFMQGIFVRRVSAAVLDQRQTAPI